MRRFLSIILLLASGAIAQAAAPGVINQYNALCNPSFPTQCAKPDSSGNLPITAPSSGVTAAEKSTAADPSYSEGTNNPLSGNLTGYLRTILPSSQIITTGTAGTPSAQVLSVQGVSGGTGVTVSGTGTAGTANAGVVTVQGIASMTPVGVSVASGGVASGAVASGAFASGSIASGAVASGAFASGSMSDGSNVTLGSKTDAKSTATDATSITVMQVLKEISAVTQAPPSQAVTNTGTFAVQNGVATSGGVTAPYVVEPTASDNHANIKNGAGNVYWITAFNNSATINYLRLYNAASGFNGCNSATNLMWEGHIPASTSDAGFIMNFPMPMSFTTGISICVTGAYGNTNTTNATASAISVTVGYN